MNHNVTLLSIFYVIILLAQSPFDEYQQLEFVEPFMIMEYNLGMILYYLIIAFCNSHLDIQTIERLHFDIK